MYQEEFKMYYILLCKDVQATRAAVLRIKLFRKAMLNSVIHKGLGCLLWSIFGKFMSILKQRHLNWRRHYIAQINVHILRMQKSAQLKLNMY